MTKEIVSSNIIGLISIVASLIAFVNKENRLIVSIIFGGAIIVYVLNSFSDKIEKFEKKIKKVENQLNIYNQLVDIKADIKYLKEVSQHDTNKQKRTNK